MKKQLKRWVVAAVMALPLFGGGSSVMAQSTVPSTGGYYLYNEAGDVFLSRGAGWGTQATVDKYGVPFDISLTDGKYKLTFFDMNNTLGNADGAVYTDNVNNAFTFKASGTGWLAYSESAAKWLTIDANNVMQFTTDQSAATVWNFKTLAEYATVRESIKAKQLQNLVTASGFTDVADEAEFQAKLASDFMARDRTSLVANAALSNNINSWTFTAGRSQSAVGGSNGVREIYEGSGTLSQTVSGLAEGIYKVTVNAFYRDGSNSSCVTHKNNGWTLSNSRLVANGYEVQIKDWASERTGDKNPNDTGEANTSFAGGNYLNTVYAYVGADGTMTITLNFPQYIGAGWACFNNVTLTYYDNTVTSEEASALLASVPTGVMDATLQSELDAAKAAFESTNTIPLYNALLAKIEAANASIADYAKVKAALDKGYLLTEPALSTFAAQADSYKEQYDNRNITDATAALAILEPLYLNCVPEQKGDNSDMTALIKNADFAAGKENWTTSGTVGINSNEHWSGETNTYIEPCDWNATGWTSSFSQEITLPNGIYTLKAAARASADVTFTLRAGTAEASGTGLGATGGSIATDGTEWESLEAGVAAGKTFAKDGAGYGWIYTTITNIEVTDGKLTIGGSATTGSQKQWCSFDDFQLTMVEYVETVSEEVAAAILARIPSGKMNAGVQEALNTAKATFESNKTQDNYAVLDEAIAAAELSIKDYEYLARELATATSVGADVTEQQAGYDNGSYDEAGAIAAAQAANVATYNKVKDTYAYPYALDAWAGEIGAATGQHWSGNASTGYYDTNGTNIERSLTNTVTLPAGDYVLKAAGRSASAATMVLDINGTKVTFTAKGDTGYGIDTNGDANFSADGTYANGGAGRGWEWEHLRLTLTEETTLTLKATITTSGWAWGSFSDITLQMDEATYVNLRYPELGELLEACKPVEETSEYATTTYPAYQEAYTNKTYTTVATLEAAMTDLQTTYNAYCLGVASPEHPYDITAQVIKNADCTANDNWPGSGRSTQTGEHWSGDAGRVYFAQNHESGPARSQAITLPYKGVYLLKSAVRVCGGNGYATISIDQPNDAERSTTQLGRTGGTIATDGTEWPSVADGIAAGKTFANNNNGRGWYYSNLYFAVLDDAQMSRSLSINLSNVNNGREANCGGMTLYYLGEGPVVRTVDNKTVHYGMYPAGSSIELTDATPIADLRRASLTGATVTGTNPNGLVFANSTDAVVGNNVVVNGTCASLSLTDGHAFVTPEAFTATAATYTMSAVATSGDKSFGTLCLPFEVTTVAGTTYALDKGVTVNDQLYGTEVTTIPAGTPVLVTTAGEYTGAGQVAATTAGATFQSGELVGTYEGCTAPVSSYVLQKHSDRLAFYLVGADVQPTVKPFRAYIAPQASGVRMLDIALDGELTGIESATTKGTATITACYDAQGRRIAAPRRGLNILHMSDGTIQKVIIK